MGKAGGEIQKEIEKNVPAQTAALEIVAILAVLATKHADCGDSSVAFAFVGLRLHGTNALQCTVRIVKYIGFETVSRTKSKKSDRDYQATVQLSPETKQLLDRFAEKLGQSRGEFLWRVLSWLSKEAWTTQLFVAGVMPEPDKTWVEWFQERTAASLEIAKRRGVDRSERRIGGGKVARSTGHDDENVA